MAASDNPHLDAVRAFMAKRLAQQGGGLASSAPFPVYETLPPGDSPPEDALVLSSEEMLAECRMEPETDIGNARRLLIRYGDRILFVARVAWHGYDGRRWKEDEDGSIVRPLAQKTAEWIMDEAFGLDAGPEEQAAIVAGDEARREAKVLGLTVAARCRAASIHTPAEAKRLAALAIAIEQAAAAKKTLARLGTERKRRAAKPVAAGTADTAVAASEEAHVLRAMADFVVVGEGAQAEADAIEEARRVRASAGWTAEETREDERLARLVEEGEAAKKAVAGRESSRFRHAKSSAGTAKLNNMLTEAAPHVSKMVGDLNRDRMALNCANGTLRFVRVEDEESEPDDPRFLWRARLDPHRQGDLITKLAPQIFDGSGAWMAKAPAFDKFLKTVLPDPEIRAFLKRFFGYCLTGLTIEQCLLFLYGIGRNGKSTFVEAVTETIGDYAVTLSIDSFAGDTRRGGAEATPDLARLPGARLVIAAEPEMGVKLKDALIKTLTGGDKIPVRRLHQDFIEVDPQFKIVLVGNHKPRIDDTSDGIWRRVLLVPFDVQVPKADVDRGLPRRLRAEAAGIFAWAVEGGLEYLNYGLAPPDKVLAATQAYREESDPIGTFIRVGCIVTGKEEDFAVPGDLYIGYANWAGKEGAVEFKQNTFSRRFPDYALKTWEGPDGRMHSFWKGKSGTTVYRGIRVRDEFVAPGKGPEPSSYPEGYGG